MFFDSVDNAVITDSFFLDNQSNAAGLESGGGGAITSFLGDITISTTVFSGNKGSNGFDILVEDNSDPVSEGGTFINCEEEVVFCNSKTGYSELADDDNDSYANSNCPTRGVEGTPGEGPCPKQKKGKAKSKND